MEEEQLRRKLVDWLVRDDEVLHALRSVRALNLRDGYIAAGFVRNFIWDRLHGYERRTPLNDTDVIYYCPENICEEADLHYEKMLHDANPGWNWSVKNQARMHVRNGHPPYASIEDAMKRWPETATAVAVRIDDGGRVHIVAPFGLRDLFGLVVRRSPYFDDVDYFHIKQKNWCSLWPRLNVVE